VFDTGLFKDDPSIRRREIMQKISRRVVKKDTGYTSPCLIWVGPTSGDTGRGAGYGRVCISGQTVAVHLVVYTHFHGYIPGKKQIDHLCNQRLCCNPDHLEMVTHLRNQIRRAKRRNLISVE
jgi:HNH endonuclease